MDLVRARSMIHSEGSHRHGVCFDSTSHTLITHPPSLRLSSSLAFVIHYIYISSHCDTSTRCSVGGISLGKSEEASEFVVS
jgi:hypothetical protein